MPRKPPTRPAKARSPRRGSAVAPALFPKLCVAQGLPEPIPEYRFHPTRKWRFDWAIPFSGGVAVEVDGGIWTQGRHTRGAGWLRDQEKGNEAVAMGWRVLHVTPSQLCRPSTFALIRRALDWGPDAA